MKKSKISDGFVVGFALFATFFGAGNLIFPPLIGITSGSDWGSAIVGMSISAVLLPILTIIAVNHMGDDLSDLTRPVSPWFFSAYMIVFSFFLCTVGVPRQGGIAIETGIFSIVPSLADTKYGLFISILLYFTLVFILAANLNKVVDVVGKYLTPILLFILLGIVVLAIVTPIGTPGAPDTDNALRNAFLEGYQTGDVMVGIVVAGTLVKFIRDKGYSSRGDVNKVIIKAAAIAFFGLLVVYGGFLYLGATASQIFAHDMDATLLLNALVNTLAGNVWSKIFGVGVFIACLTTTIGVLSSTANMITKLLQGKVPYKVALALCCVVSSALGSLGVSAIIKYSLPSFSLIYPVSIVLTLLGVFRKYVPNHGAWKGAVAMAVVVGGYEAVNMLFSQIELAVNWGVLETIYSAIPLSKQGIAWLVPSIIGFLVGAAIVKARSQDAYPMLSGKERGDQNANDNRGVDVI